MARNVWSVTLASFALLVFAAEGSFAGNSAQEAAVNRAKKAIGSGKVEPERDLKPLIDALRTAKDDDDQRWLIDKVESLGAADGNSPAEVKRYLLDNATPVLLEIGRSGGSVFARGDALTALRDMGGPRPVLEEAASIAERDRDSYVQSRGEILRNYLKSMPAESQMSAIKPVDAGKEKQGIARLKARGLGVSADQLRRSALEGDQEAVRALVDAGVDVNSGEGLSRTALDSAVFSGCGAKAGETDALVKTVEVLLGAGADVKRKDDNGNNILMHAAQMCGPKIVEKLIAAGAEVDVKNGSGMTPLAMALLMKRVEAAEVLATRGARLSPQQVQMLSASATDERTKAVIQRASQK